MMDRIGLIAGREFVAAIGNRGFLIGLIIMPAIVGLITTLAPRLLNARLPQVQGEIVVIDPTNRVLPEIRQALSVDGIAARRAEATRRALERVSPGSGAVASSAASVFPPTPTFTLLDRPPDSDLAPIKQWLIETPPAGAAPHLAVIVVQADAVTSGNGREYGAYDLYVARGVDEQTEAIVYDGMRQALVAARLQARALDRVAIEATMRVERPRAVIVANGGEQQAARGFTRLLPFAMGILLFLGVMMCGQTLMTSTIEEKSNRVVEVLLAAVSPMELMAGKLIGQLGVGLLLMSVYIGLGILALFQFALLGFLDPMLVVYLLLFFLMSFLIYGALMMAAGAAVNHMADAQSLMGPLMVLLIAPYVLTPMIGRAPNSTFSVVLSFLPPVNSFAMLARLASDSPPPGWQVGVTVIVGLAAAAGAVWFAAKIFKTGLLMHGKPPNLATLIRWARMA